MVPSGEVTWWCFHEAWLDVVLYIHTDEPAPEEQSPVKTMMEPSAANVGVNVVVFVLDERKGKPDVNVCALAADEDVTVDDMSKARRLAEAPAGEKM